jgi:hypothetical protein
MTEKTKVAVASSFDKLRMTENATEGCRGKRLR